MIDPTSLHDVLNHLEPQLEVEEGNKALIYDDATGKPFKVGDTLRGNISAGVGLNLMIPFDPAELKFMEDFRLARGIALLAPYAWFNGQDEVRQTALADLAYNIGVTGLLHWVHFLSFMGNHDYPSAVGEIRSNALWLSQVGPVRSGRLETMILTGDWPADIHVPGASS